MVGGEVNVCLGNKLEFLGKLYGKKMKLPCLGVNLVLLKLLEKPLLVMPKE